MISHLECGGEVNKFDRNVVREPNAVFGPKKLETIALHFTRSNLEHHWSAATPADDRCRFGVWGKMNMPTGTGAQPV